MPGEKFTRRQKNIPKMLREKRQIYKDKLKAFKKKGHIFQIILILLLPLSCFAWEGFDYGSCHYIDIYKRKGKDIQFYDYSDGELHRGEIINLKHGGYKLGVFDYETGKIRLFEMERK